MLEPSQDSTLSLAVVVASAVGSVEAFHVASVEASEKVGPSWWEKVVVVAEVEAAEVVAESVGVAWVAVE